MVVNVDDFMKGGPRDQLESVKTVSKSLVNVEQKDCLAERWDRVHPGQDTVRVWLRHCTSSMCCQRK